MPLAGIDARKRRHDDERHADFIRTDVHVAVVNPRLYQRRLAAVIAQAQRDFAFFGGVNDARTAHHHVGLGGWGQQGRACQAQQRAEAAKHGLAGTVRKPLKRALKGDRLHS
ncbi:hypothetical protein D3C72_2040820 [compost metagenome]